jgi:hypothetical protein
VSTETSRVQFRPITIHRVYVLHLESRASKIYDSTNREAVDVKWLELDFNPLLSSECVLRMVQSAVFRPRIVTNKITVLRIATDRSADWHRPDLAACILCQLRAELGNPQCN